MKEDYYLETLLDLDGYVTEIGNGFWVKIEAKRVKVTTGRPFGIKYSLTLHSPAGERILGMDNAHSVLGFPSKKPHDHIHGEKVRPYQYKDASKLLEDFWKKVDIVMKGERGSI